MGAVPQDQGVPQVGQRDAMHGRCQGVEILIGVKHGLAAGSQGMAAEFELVRSPLQGVSDCHVVPPEPLFEGLAPTVPALT